MRARFLLLLVASLCTTPASSHQPTDSAVSRAESGPEQPASETAGAVAEREVPVLRPRPAPEPQRGDGRERDGALAARGFVECLARHRNGVSREYLAAAPYSDAAERASDRIAGRWSSCLSFSDYQVSVLRLEDQALRGALSEAMYLHDHPDRAPAALFATDPEPIAQAAFAARLEESRDPGQEVVRMFAECLVDRQPAMADTLMRTEFRSPAEREVIGLFSPSMGDCLFEGQQLSVGPENLRFAIAEALYRKVALAPQPIDDAILVAEATE